MLQMKIREIEITLKGLCFYIKNSYIKEVAK
jgi:hypothetical protein